MASTLPIVVYQPASMAVDFFAQDPDTGLPIDLTSVTQISVSVLSSAPPVCITKTLTGGGVIIIGSPTMGHFQAQFTSADVLSMALSTQDSNGVIDPTTLLAFTVKITDPTNPNRNPYVNVVSGALAVFASPC